MGISGLGNMRHAAFVPNMVDNPLRASVRLCVFGAAGVHPHDVSVHIRWYLEPIMYLSGLKSVLI